MIVHGSTSSPEDFLSEFPFVNVTNNSIFDLLVVHHALREVHDLATVMGIVEVPAGLQVIFLVTKEEHLQTINRPLG